MAIRVAHAHGYHIGSSQTLKPSSEQTVLSEPSFSQDPHRESRNSDSIDIAIYLSGTVAAAVLSIYNPNSESGAVVYAVTDRKEHVFGKDYSLRAERLLK
jgi:hypothetical protein